MALSSAMRINSDEAKHSDHRATMRIPDLAQNIIVIENLVTGFVAEIDLNATHDSIQFDAMLKGPRRGRTIIEPVLPRDYADPFIDWEMLEEDALNQNALAEAAHITDRFCRCGNLADLGFRIGSKQIWRCHECRGDNLEDE